MRDLGPIDFVQVKTYSRPAARGSYPSAMRSALRGDSLEDYRPHLSGETESYEEPYPFQAKILDAPDQLDPQEGRLVVQGALDHRIPLPFDHRRGGFQWQALVDRLQKYGYEPVAPSLGQRPRRTLPSLLGVR